MSKVSEAELKTGLASLAERCEAAEGPDRELDADILEALNDERWKALEREAAMPCGAPVDTVRREARTLAGYRYRFTYSLDAAMTLVPEGWLFGRLTQNCHNLRWYCDLDWHPLGDDCDIASGINCPTPALALCAAALRARETMRPDTVAL